LWGSIERVTLASMNLVRGVAVGAALVAAGIVAGCAPSGARLHSPAGPSLKTSATLVHEPRPLQAPPVGVVSMAPCSTASGPPAASRLGSPKDYPGMQIHLTVVAPTIEPKVTARAAFASLGYYLPGPSACGLSQTLAYFSSDSPGTMPADCEVPATLTTPWAAPTDCPITPLYPHVLAWVFTWRSDCESTGGPAQPVGAPPHSAPTLPPLACTAITFVDAATGHRSDYLTIGTS
jgi:hypothetical protein